MQPIEAGLDVRGGEQTSTKTGGPKKKSAPRVNERRKLLIVAEDATNRVWSRRGGRSEASLQQRTAGAEQRKLAASSENSRERLQQQIEALLTRKAGDNAEQRPVDALRQPHLRLQRGLVANAHVDAQSAIVLRQRNVGTRIPDGIVDAVDDSLHDRSAGAQETIEPHAELRRHDLACICG